MPTTTTTTSTTRYQQKQDPATIPTTMNVPLATATTPHHPQDSVRTTSTITSKLPIFCLRGGGGGGSTINNVNVHNKISDVTVNKNATYDDTGFDDEHVPHTQLALEECAHDIRKLESTLASGTEKNRVSTTASRVIDMADKVRKLTKLVKELNEKVTTYENIIFERDMAESDALLKSASVSKKRGFDEFSTASNFYSPENRYTSNRSTQQNNISVARLRGGNGGSMENVRKTSSVENPYIRRRLNHSATAQVSREVRNPYVGNYNTPTQNQYKQITYNGSTSSTNSNIR